MPTQIEVIQWEMPGRGICYLICRIFDPADFSVLLANLTKKAFQSGAKGVSFTNQDGAFTLPEDGFSAGAYRFTREENVYLLYKELDAESLQGIAPLRTKPLRESNAELYRALYGESFAEMPNAQTVTAADTDALLKNEHRICGFFMDGGMPVGCYLIRLDEALPEIAVVAVSPAFRGSGYGKRGLATLERTLQAHGYFRVQLPVSDQNRRALALYRGAGYGDDTLLCRRYEARPLV